MPKKDTDKKFVDMNKEGWEEEVRDAEKAGWHPSLVFPGQKKVKFEKVEDIKGRGAEIQKRLEQQKREYEKRQKRN